MEKNFINREEALRYLGYGKTRAQGEILRLIERCEKEIEEAAGPKFIYSVWDMDKCPIELSGNDIKRHLEGCGRVILFGATAGAGVDSLIRRLQIENMTKAVIADAVASAYIEGYCKYADAKIAQELSGSYITWRFSPGYGDFPIELQEDLIKALRADKLIGLCTNESCFLTPKKSVTAVMGISENEIKKEKRGCAVCNMSKTCKFIKRGEHCGV